MKPVPTRACLNLSDQLIEHLPQQKDCLEGSKPYQSEPAYEACSYIRVPGFKPISSLPTEGSP